MQTRENRLAVEIVDTLMTVAGETGTRLVVWDDNKKYFPDRGGWCREAAIREVENVLIANAVQPVAGGRG